MAEAASDRELTEHVNQPLPKAPSHPSPLLLVFSPSFEYDCLYCINLCIEREKHGEGNLFAIGLS